MVPHNITLMKWRFMIDHAKTSLILSTNPMAEPETPVPGAGHNIDTIEVKTIKVQEASGAHSGLWVRGAMGSPRNFWF